MNCIFVRVGALADVFVASSKAILPKGRRVILRTPRGVELGEVVGPCRRERPEDPTMRVLRPTTDEDEWLIKRLDRYKRQAVEACRTALKEAGSDAVLLDVSQLFDGGTLVMHFMGEVDDQAREVTQLVAREYERVAQTREFAKNLSDGCGPNCGTESGAGCGSGCGSCAVGCKV